jgi:hypothetical protein
LSVKDVLGYETGKKTSGKRLIGKKKNQGSYFFVFSQRQSAPIFLMNNDIEIGAIPTETAKPFSPCVIYG